MNYIIVKLFKHEKAGKKNLNSMAVGADGIIMREGNNNKCTGHEIYVVGPSPIEVPSGSFILVSSKGGLP